MLDDVMRAAKVTNKALAEITGVSQRTIESYRSGRREPSLSMGLKIADALKVDPHTLVKGDISDESEIPLF